MKKEIMRERVSLLESYIDDNMRIEELINEKQMGVLNGRTMECPFHEDLSPSMFVDTKGNRFKCHSCGRGGRYVKLYEHWAKELDKRQLNYYEVLEEILNSSPVVPTKLGFYSIFKSRIELLDLEQVSVSFKERKPLTKVEEYQLPLTARVKKAVIQYKQDKRSLESLLDLFAQVQKGGRFSLTEKNKVEEETIAGPSSLEELMNTLL